jgi:hypothetical protein
MKQNIIIKMDGGNVEEVITTLPIEGVYVIDSDVEGADEGDGDNVCEIDNREYFVSEPPCRRDTEFVKKVVTESYKGKITRFYNK